MPPLDRPGDSPLVSVVVPILNETRRLPGLLESLAAQDLMDFEIILVDAGSTDGTPDVVRQWAAGHPGLPVRLLDNPAQHIPHGLNLGIAAACGQIVARLDGHCQPAADYLRQSVAALAQPGAAVVGGQLDIRPGGPGPVARAIAIAVGTPLGAGDARYRLGGPRPEEVDTVPFGCFRRALWEKLDGYNESLLANEDYEFYWRARQTGGRVYFDPTIRCVYYARSTWPELAGQYWRYGWWKAQMLRRHPASVRWRQLVPALWALLGPLMIVITALWSRFWPLALAFWGLYSLLVLVEACRRARGMWPIWLGVAWAYLVIHFAWGWGVWLGLALGAVRRRAPASPWTRPPA